MHKVVGFVVVAGALFAGSAGLSYGAGQHEHGHDEEMAGHHGHGGGAEVLDVPHWSKTLTGQQRKEVDRMHHELDRVLDPLKADEQRVHKELNRLTIQDNVKLSDINKLIDELMAIKNKILRHRHAHLIEMRAILTAEQRVSYDAAVLKRYKIE